MTYETGLPVVVAVVAWQEQEQIDTVWSSGEEGTETEDDEKQGREDTWPFRVSVYYNDIFRFNIYNFNFPALLSDLGLWLVAFFGGNNTRSFKETLGWIAH